MERVKEGLKSLNETFFGETSPVSMAVFRIFMGGIAALAILQILPNFEAFYTEQGLYSVAFAERWSGHIWRWNPMVWWPDPSVGYAIFLITLVAALFTCAGAWTRVSSIVLYLGMTAIHHRTPDVLNSGDTLLRQYLFLLCLAPAGAALSVDRLRALKVNPELGAPKRVSIWPQRLMQFQLAIVYFTTVWWKMMGSKWRDGTATWYPARLNEFDRFPYPAFIDDVPMVYVATYGTLLVELALATLVFAKPFRKWVVLAGAGMHAWIEYSMNIPFFSAIIVSSYIVYYEGDEVQAWLLKVSERFGNPKWMGFVRRDLASEEMG